MTTLLVLGLAPTPGSAFCGFFVAQADARLFNSSSRVVLARHDDRTVITMENDYQGDPAGFAMVVPVPEILSREQIHVGDTRLLDRLDVFSAPRLVEYHDPDPCARPRRHLLEDMALRPASAVSKQAAVDAEGVTVEARYAVGEYDIHILSATESRGLEAWLHANGYRLPPGADRILRSYIRQGLHFFVARVSLERHESEGYATLRPLQIAFGSPRFVLPLRLGTLNAKGPQELFVFTLTASGRVEAVNYPTTPLPTDVELPLFVKHDFADFYRALFEHQSEALGRSSVFLEYAWDTATCDPCATQPLSPDELRELGVFWTGSGRTGGARGAFVTRLHLRYDAASFPQDLVLQETPDRRSFQGRYVLRNPWPGEASCRAGDDYRQRLSSRYEQQAQTLASLTGWDRAEIESRMRRSDDWPSPRPRRWWQDLWPRQ
jgi:hypothetical protein